MACASFVNLYMAPEIVCYDGETPPPADPPPPAEPPKVLSQADLDKALSEDRRKHQAQYQKLESQLNDTLKKAQLTAEQRTQLEQSLDDVRKQLLTKEELAKEEKRKLENDFNTRLTAAEQRAAAAEKQLTDSTIDRALRDAAVDGDAFSADQVVRLLRDGTKLVDGKVMIDYLNIDKETGETKVLQMSPAEAIRKMKSDDVNRFGNLFKSGVVGGIGGTGSAGSLPNGGKVNVKNVSMDQYMKLRKENPAALGLA